MLLEINSKLLSKALKIASKITAKRTSIPATSSILLEATETDLKVMATNMEVSFCASLECSISKTGSVLVDAAKLTAAMGTYDDTVVLKALKNGLSIVCGDSKFSLSGSPVDNFPKTFSVEGSTPFKLSSKDFLEMLARTAYMVLAYDYTNTPHLAGINVSIDKNILMLAATDTMRIASTHFEASEDFLVNSNTTIPKAVLSDLLSILSENSKLEFGTDGSKYLFKCGSYLLASTVVAQKYPDFSNMFLSGTGISIDRVLLLKALGRSTILADKKALVNEFAFSKNKLTIKVDDSEGSCDDVIPIKNDEEFTVSFRIKQIADFLSSLESDTVLFVYDDRKVKFNLVEPNSPYNTKYILNRVVSQ